MRSFAVINPRFWTHISETGTEIRRMGPEAALVALYLVTSPHSNALGLYYLPLSLLSEEVVLPPERARTVLDAVCATGFAEYFPEHSAVWVPEMARFQIGATLKRSDRRVAWALRELRKFEGTAPAERFLERYGAAYHLATEESPSGASLRLVPDKTKSPPRSSGSSGSSGSAQPPRSRGKATDPPGPSRERLEKAHQLSAMLQGGSDEN
jgi:hypothetical protein